MVKGSDELRTIAQHNDRSSFELILEGRIADMLIDRHEQNAHLVDIFFEKPGFKKLLISYLAGTYDEFRREAAS